MHCCNNMRKRFLAIVNFRKQNAIGMLPSKFSQIKLFASELKLDGFPLSYGVE